MTKQSEEPRPPRTFKQNLRVFLPIAVIQVTLYMTLNQVQWFTPRYLPLTPIDEAIPFLPWTVVPYMVLLTVGVAPALVAQRDTTIRRLVIGYVVCAAITVPFFVFLPTVCYRPEIPASATGWDIELFRLLTAVDTPACCFPSFHIILPALCCWSALHERRPWAVPFALVAAVLSITILTTKQHYLWDLLGGYAVAAIGIWVSGMVNLRWRMVE